MSAQMYETPVSRETAERLEAYVGLLLAENQQQNLIARSTEAEVWERHIRDSLQLIDHAPSGLWLDIGSGAGLPGLVVAIARPDQPMVLIEPRARRATFLRDAATSLSLENVQVVAAKVESVEPIQAAVITARAVAKLDHLFEIGARHAAEGCVWLLSKGRGAATELAEARRTWHGRFDLIPSITDPEAAIVMARNVKRAGARRVTR